MLRLGISIKQTGHQSAQVFIDSRMSKVIYVYINNIIIYVYVVVFKMVSNTLYVHPSFVIDEPNFLVKVFNLDC